MNRQSIFFTITISFIISIILVIISFGILMVGSHKRVEHSLIEKYEPIVKMILRQHFRHGKVDKRLEEHLDALNYKLFQRKGPIDGITYNPKTKVLVEKRSPRDFFYLEFYK